MNAQSQTILNALTTPIDWGWEAKKIRELEADLRAEIAGHKLTAAMLDDADRDLRAAEAQLEDMRGRLVEARAELARIRSRKWWRIWN